MKQLLIVTAFIEGTTGFALMTAPSFVIKLLLGSALKDPVNLIVTRVAGTALLSIAIACWCSRKYNTVTGLPIALLFYNLASIVLLGYAGLQLNLNGIVLWPAVATHFVMASWCAKVLYNTKT